MILAFLSWFSIACIMLVPALMFCPMLLAPDCIACQTGTAKRQYQIVVTDIAEKDGTCGTCGDLNATYIVDFDSSEDLGGLGRFCHWSCELDGTCGYNVFRFSVRSFTFGSPYDSHDLQLSMRDSYTGASPIMGWNKTTLGGGTPGCVFSGVTVNGSAAAESKCTSIADTYPVPGSRSHCVITAL